MNGRAVALSVFLLVGIGVITVQQSSPSSGRVRVVPGDSEARISSDDTLRRLIARSIYGHPAFWRDAAMPEPPIQILVNDGHVILTGTVAGELERALACSLARGHGEATLTNHLRTRAGSFN